MHVRHPFTVVERYSATARLFHWLTTLLVVVAYIVSVGGPSIRRSMISAAGCTSCSA
jgi:cytochrome b561